MSNSSLEDRSKHALITSFETETGETRLIKLYYYPRVPWQVTFVGSNVIYPVSRELLYKAVILRRNAGYGNVLVYPPNATNYILVDLEGYKINMPAAEVRRFLLSTFQLISREKEVTDLLLEETIQNLSLDSWTPRYLEG